MQTARTRWAAAYRDARKVRTFNLRFHHVLESRTDSCNSVLVDAIQWPVFNAVWRSVDRLSYPSDKEFPRFKIDARGPLGRLPA